jgi:16S rRNA processing protein RimM
VSKKNRQVVFLCPEIQFAYLCPMETIPKPECQQIGFIRKIHGVHGELVLEFEPAYEESVAEAGCFFIEIDGLLVPFFVSEEGFRFKSAKTALIRFDEVKSEKYARRLMGSPVYLYKDEITEYQTKSLESVPYLNYLLIDEKTGQTGTISEINDYSGNIVFTVHFSEKDVLIPFNTDLVVSIDDPLKKITIRLPEGLIE